MALYTNLLGPQLLVAGSKLYGILLHAAAQ